MVKKNMNEIVKIYNGFARKFTNFFIILIKNKNPFEAIVGFAILFISVYFLIWGLMTAKTNNITGYHLTSNFSSIGGLSRGADVSVNGVKVGSVIETKLNPINYSIDVIMSIDSKYKFPEETKAKISTYGIIGDKYIKFEIGSSDELIEPNGELKSIPFKSLEEIIGDMIFKTNT